MLGFVGVAGLFALAVGAKSIWIGIMAGFVLYNCWIGFRGARAMMRRASARPRTGLACPRCGVPPPEGPFWVCETCRRPFDPFETQSICPGCGERYATTNCGSCGVSHPIGRWYSRPPGSEPDPPAR